MSGTMRVLVLPFVASLILAACGGGNAASQLAKPPDFAPKDQTKCGVEKSQAKPLIVEWPSADRGELEAQAHNRGLVVVRYEGCEMQVLDRCTTPVKYSYMPMTRKKDRVVMRDADDLFANVPIGAARLEAKLEKSGELDVEMTLVGRWEAARASLRADELQGECAGATHVIWAMTTGAFTFTAGADASVGGGIAVAGVGGGAQSSSQRETLSADGDENACERAKVDDTSPPPECGALIRVEVVPLATGSDGLATLKQASEDRMHELAWLLGTVTSLERTTQCPFVPRDRAAQFASELAATRNNLDTFNQQLLVLDRELAVLADAASSSSVTVRVRDLGQRYDELKDQIRRSHTRIALLSDTIAGGSSGRIDDTHPCGQ
jgi:hypothetical protein